MKFTHSIAFKISVASGFALAVTLILNAIECVNFTLSPFDV